MLSEPPVDREVEAVAAGLRPSLELNEHHALAVSDDLMNTRELRAEIRDFAYIQALRKLPPGDPARRPAIVSAGAVLVCPRRRCLLVHRRSSHSATYPGVLHILGGAYKPPLQFSTIDNPGDRGNLEFTMIREVFEESSIIVRRYPKKEPVCVARETDTGFVQYVFLGVRITARELEDAATNSEGEAVAIGFDKLRRELSDPSRWVPIGRAHLLMWLALGAPGAGRLARFGGKTAIELFDDLTGD